jgi:hypothetical protein
VPVNRLYRRGEFAAAWRIFAYTDNSFPDVLAIRAAAIKASIHSTGAVSCVHCPEILLLFLLGACANYARHQSRTACVYSTDSHRPFRAPGGLASRLRSSDRNGVDLDAAAIAGCSGRSGQASLRNRVRRRCSASAAVSREEPKRNKSSARNGATSNSALRVASLGAQPRQTGRP